MIVKNEEKYLRRCLESLVPILREVDSELIIADTGSTDGSVEIAREFTENVFHFPWCDDFAAARNATLKRAKGEWFMAVDADEIFEDTSEIINFFNSGEYKRFNSATFIQRNFNSENSKVVSDFNAPRLTKIKKDTVYISPIHEYLSTFGSPIKRLSAVALHYGYVTEGNREFISQKAERNLRLLFKKLEENPSDCMALFHISHTYCLLPDFKTALEYCDKALHLAKEQNNVVLFSLYATKVSILYATSKYQKALTAIEDYFGSKTGPLGTDLEMHYYKAECLRRLQDNKGAISAYRKYLEFFKEYHNGLHHTIDTLQHSVNFTSDAAYREAVYYLTELLIDEGEYESAARCSRMVRVSDWADDRQYLIKRLSQEIRLMKSTGDFSGLTGLYGQLNEKSVGILQELLDKEIAEGAFRERVLEAFWQSGLPKTEYIRAMEIRYKYYCSKTLCPQDLHDFLSSTERFSQFYTDILYLTLLFKLPVELFVKGMDAFELAEGFSKLDAFQFDDLPELIFELSQSKAETASANTLLYMSYLYLWALSSNGLKTEQAAALFEAYARTFDRYISAIFRKEILDKGDASLLPKPLRAGYCCGLALKARESGRDKEYLQHLKAALRLEPRLVNVIKDLLEEFQREKKEQEGRERLSELEAYAVRVKQNIAFLIDSGNAAQAAGLLDAYEQLCPNDADIPALKERLRDASRRSKG